MAPAEGIPALWDYHVVLVLRSLSNENERTSLIYDFDTTLGLPYDAKDYLEQTFPYIADPSGLDARYHSLFRIVPGDVFITDFASDRSHMVVPASETSLSSVADGTIGVQNSPASAVYAVAPPLYPPIAGVRARENGVAHNLMTDFVDMNNSEGFGVVMNLGELMAWVASRD